MERENQRVSITKRMLREGLLRLLKTKELEKINITELCKEAQINRITFYRHYETPRDVLLDMEHSLLNEMKVFMKKPDSLQELKEALEQSCVFLEAHAEMIKVMIQNNTDSEFLFLFNDFFRELNDRMAKDLLGDVDSELLEILSIYNAGGGYFLMRQWVLGNIQKAPKELADIFFNQLCHTDWMHVSNQMRSINGLERDAVSPRNP